MAEECSPQRARMNGAAVVRAIINNSPNTNDMANLILNSIIYSFLGIGILVVAFFLLEVMTPKHNLRKEILENKNIALALLAGFFMLSVAIIIASAIH
jgi:putative membrane protein